MTDSKNTLTLSQLKGLNSDIDLMKRRVPYSMSRGAAASEVGNSGERSLIVYPRECDKESPGRPDMRTLCGFLSPILA